MLLAVEKAFGGNVDFAVLNKTYSAGEPASEAKRRYSPAPYGQHRRRS